MVYQINKGINQPIEFKNLKAQYIWWLGGGLVILLIGFAVLYLIGVNAFVCVAIAVIAGFGLTLGIYSLSNKHGEHGLMKLMAKRKIPKVLRCDSRKMFMQKTSVCKED